MNRKQYFHYVLIVTGIAFLAYVLRLIAIHMYDLHIDEITYAHFAQTIDAGELPRDFDGQAFFLHPPGYFALLAIWRAIFWHGGSIFAQYTVLRGLNIFLAGFSAALMVIITKLVTGSKKLGYLAGLLFSLDPFLIRQNTRGLMETATMLWLLLGIYMLLQALHKHTTKRSTWLAVGFVFGLAIVTKDVAATFLVLSLLVMKIRKVGPNRAAFRYLIPGALIPYGVWIGIVTASGYLGDFLSQKTVGIRRFFGLVQITGFNSATGPSKSGTLLQTIPHYATSYGLMGLGAAFACLLLFSKNTQKRAWGCIGLAAALVVAYLYVGGTFEEQYLYYLMVPAIISTIVGAVELWHIISSKYHKLLRRAAILGIVVTLAFSVFSYVTNMRVAPANGWQTTIGWVDKNVPNNSTVCTYGQGDFLLGGHGYNVCGYTTMGALQSNHVQYIIVSDKLTNDGYEPISVNLFAQVKKISTVAFSYTSADSGTFEVIKMNNPFSTPAPDTTPPSTKSIATANWPTAASSTAPTTQSSTSTTVPGTLPNTGISLASSFKVFLTSMSLGTAIAYLFFHLRNRKLYREQAGVFTPGYVPGTASNSPNFLPEYAGNLAMQGVELW